MNVLWRSRSLARCRILHDEVVLGLHARGDTDLYAAERGVDGVKEHAQEYPRTEIRASRGARLPGQRSAPDRLHVGNRGCASWAAMIRRVRLTSPKPSSKRSRMRW